MRALVWLRSDLRVADNPALHHACRHADDGVVAAFAICKDQWRIHDDAPIKVDFWIRNLTALSESLAKKNIALKLIDAPRFADVPAAMLELATELACDRLYFNRQYEVNERERDRATVELFESRDLSVRSFDDQTIFKPGDLRTGKGGFYTVFTPFKRAWYKAHQSDPDQLQPLPAPAKQPEMVGAPDTIPDRVDGFQTDVDSDRLWPAGEQAANARLREFIKNRIRHYADSRDFPAKIGTSSLSPYLASGVLSLRQCCHAAADSNSGRVDSGCAGTVCWINELIWREFYKHLLVGFPRLSRHRAYKIETERITWNDNDKFHEAWCNGQTGVSIVDSAMRQLVQTGWMHNRLRMVTAMFYTKNLFLDWKRGERFFMQHLIDGDLSANNGGWQWSASTGTDAAPYFRVFNPYSQSRKFDPDGEFIRMFVPELADLDSKDIHDPGEIPVLLRSGIDYPEPIVDCVRTRAAAIEAFKSL